MKKISQLFFLIKNIIIDFKMKLKNKIFYTKQQLLSNDHTSDNYNYDAAWGGAHEFFKTFIQFLDENINDKDIYNYDHGITTDNNAVFYNEEFYRINATESYDSAIKIINILKQYYLPTSVFDLGCGVGTWLKAWLDNGSNEVLGVDANEMSEKFLYVPRDCLKIVDFEKQSIKLKKKYDLAMSLECFEHISNRNEKIAFDTLTNASDLILFSAAIPFQVGTNHINCHKLSYWVKMFKTKGYKCYDIIRPECIKQALNIGEWYIQNILVFAKNEKANILESKSAIPIETPIMFYHQKVLRDILIMNRGDHCETEN